ncbi:MAG: CHAT domain-containing protein [bacterium]|nr:CHAT domain-containing protein [bacterium]
MTRLPFKVTSVVVLALLAVIGIWLGLRLHSAEDEATEIAPPAVPSKTAPAAAEEPELGPESVLERELTGEEQHTYALELEADEYVHAVVEQDGIDVAVALLDPGGRTLLKVDSPTGARGAEAVYLVAKTAGRHRLQVRSWPGSPSGRFRLRLASWRSATAADRDRAAAALVFAEAEELRRKGRRDAYRAAIRSYRQAARLWQAAGETRQQALAMSRVGWMFDELGETDESIGWLTRSLERFRESGDDDTQIASILSRLGCLYRTIGELQEARTCHEEALRLARELEDPRREAFYLQNLGLVYKTLGKPQQALTCYEQAIALWRGLDELVGKAGTLANLSVLYSWLGQLERAQELLEESLRLSREAGDRHAEARALAPLGAVQRRRGELRESLDSLRQLLALRQALQDHRGEAVALKELARTHFELGEYEQAQRAGEDALAFFREMPERKNEAEVLSDLGRLHEQLDDPPRALACFTAALKAFALAGSRSGEASALYGAALAERKHGDLGAARARVEEAVAIVESLRTQTEILELRSSYLAAKQDYYELYIDLLIEIDVRDPTAEGSVLALEVSERRRARTLLDLLIEPSPDPDPALRARERDLQRLIDAKDRERPGGEAAAGDRAGVERELEQLLRAREELRAEIRVGSSRASLVEAPPRLSSQDIQQLLDDDTLLLEYSLGEARSFLWLVTPTDLQHYELPGRSEIEKLARDAHGLLAGSRGRRRKGRLMLVTAELSRLLLQPVAERLATKRLLVVSDEALQYIPLAALPLPAGHPALGRARGGPAQPMVTEHEIVHLPSLAVLAVLRRQRQARRPAPKLVGVVADPVFDPRDPRVEKPASGDPTPSDPGDPDLPWLGRLVSSRAEAEAILALVPEGQGLAALDFDAGRELVMSGALADYRYVHFATHGRFDPQQPELLELVLSQVDEHGRPRDGSLRSHEIYRLNLPVEMVTLSACRSGLGREVRGEGLVGLTQAFLHAGAARVVVSLWKVDDRATAELMERFYRGIFEDELRPAAALRAAQLSMLREQRWEAPYYWAGFFLQGEWR